MFAVKVLVKLLSVSASKVNKRRCLRVAVTPEEPSLFTDVRLWSCWHAQPASAAPNVNAWVCFHVEAGSVCIQQAEQELPQPSACFHYCDDAGDTTWGGRKLELRLINHWLLTREPAFMYFHAHIQSWGWEGAGAEPAAGIKSTFIHTLSDYTVYNMCVHIHTQKMCSQLGNLLQFL